MKLLTIGGKYVRTANGLVKAPQSSGEPFEAYSEDELLALLTAKNKDKVIHYNGEYYLIAPKKIAVGDTLSTVYFDTSWLPYVYTELMPYDTLIGVGKATVVYIVDGEEVIREVSKGLEAQNIDDPQQAELAWWNYNFDRLEVSDDGTYTVDGKVVTEEEATNNLGGGETVVYRDYEEFWANNGKPTGWLVDKLTFDTPVTVTELDGQEVWGDYISPTPIGTKYDFINADGSVGAIKLSVSGGDNSLAATTEEEMTALITAENEGKIVLYNGETGEYVNGEYYKITADDDDTQYYELAELTSPATAEDIASGKEAYGADGAVITGTAEIGGGMKMLHSNIVCSSGTAYFLEVADVPSLPKYVIVHGRTAGNAAYIVGGWAENTANANSFNGKWGKRSQWGLPLYITYNPETHITSVSLSTTYFAFGTDSNGYDVFILY